DEVAKRLLAKANDIVGKLKAGTPFAQVADETGLKVATATDLQRGKQGGFVPAKVVDFVFRTPKDAAGTAEGEKPTDRYVFRVTDVVDPTLDASSAQGKAINDTLQNSYVDDIVSEFIGRLENDFGLKINPAAMNQAIGGGTQQ
ncbi:MAG: peptidylprolyl isomerase, partial [Pseudolabrys sp.]